MHPGLNFIEPHPCVRVARLVSAMHFQFLATPFDLPISNLMNGVPCRALRATGLYVVQPRWYSAHYRLSTPFTRDRCRGSEVDIEYGRSQHLCHNARNFLATLTSPMNVNVVP